MAAISSEALSQAGEVPAGPPPPPGGAPGVVGKNGVLSQITLLGQDVPITWANGSTPSQQQAASGTIMAAAVVLNGNASKLTAGEVSAIHQVKSMRVVGDNSWLGINGDGRFTMSFKSLANSGSIAWVASLFPHEGQHRLNHGLFTGANAWRDEQSAAKTQLAVGAKLGMTKSQQDSFRWYSSDANRQGLQEHVKGYLYQ